MPAIDHIGIVVDSYDKARALYLEAFGAQVVREGDTGIVKYGFFSLDNVNVELIEDHGPERKRARLGGDGVLGRVDHVAFHFPDLDEAVARVQSAGVRILEGATLKVDGYTIVYPDPDSTCGVRYQMLDQPTRK